MIRTVLGGLAGGVVLYLVGFLFWGTPLANLAYSSIDDVTSANLQAALGQALTTSGTGTYIVPDPGTQQGTTLFGQGPIATVHFNTAGFPVVDSAALIAGLVLALVTGILIAFALSLTERMTSVMDRIKIAVTFALAAALYIEIGQPILNHFGWGHFVFSFLSHFIGLAAAGVVIAKWFGPKVAAERPLS